MPDFFIAHPIIGGLGKLIGYGIPVALFIYLFIDGANAHNKIEKLEKENDGLIDKVNSILEDTKRI